MMTMMKRSIMIALATVALGAGAAHAFPTGEQFDLKAIDNDGAGGIAFDGAPRWAHHTCAVCHVGAPGRISLRLESDHTELFTDGWKPGQQYHLRVVLENPWANEVNRPLGDNCGFAVMPYKACDQNGFALELDDRVGKPVGTLAVYANNVCAAPTADIPGADARLLADHSAATHTGTHNGKIAWDVCWTAPAAGAGVITAYVAAVDGNGGDGTLKFPTNNTGDDVASGAVPIAEIGGDQIAQAGGCNAAGDGGLGIVLVLALVMFRRRRLAAVLALATVASCTHVHANQRETLSKRAMQFAPDPAEDELDLHMQESREGSSGGYGSSGGGCGCN